ncbi:helix-turn-helix domain-containing protein [Bradyrhizobium elkanii]|uniref:helix-turn-helix domain-containing protein n=1 Tax=Bradyrhizobium elkanii TaxID=29448 RepID=UPI0004B9FF86|nr:helix-turn-helix transcriptional regulator [Bradyrhizobium elkanii]WLA83214.1 helix-turn-helix transcriptional regulator [Bradyrhizobium elkanii]
MSRDVAIGKHLALLRERAGIRQHELAKRLGWSTAMMSRIESGERALSSEELDTIAGAIGGEEVRHFIERLPRQWSVIEEPSFDEPDSDLIWEAEQAAQSLRSLASKPDIKPFFERRLARYEEELRSSALNLLDRRYRIALAGSIAAGKSTASCRAEGLEVPNPKGMPTPVLEAGRGGVTLCEVHVRRGPGYGILIEPCTDEEVRQYVSDFARGLFDPSADERGAEVGDNPQGVSREIDRALRNMAKLPRQHFPRQADGSRQASIDHARVLAEKTGDVRAFTVEVLDLMQLHKRDRRDMWHRGDEEKDPLVWLQNAFRQVNNGLNPEFSLPKRIEIIVPNAPLGDDAYIVTLIDTQGIDDVAGRADLEQHFDDAHTIVVLCTKFDEAPSVHIRNLLERARAAGVRTLEKQTAVLVLPRPDEAIQMTESGVPVETVQDGYDLKADQIRLKLPWLKLDDRSLLFFNSAEDNPEQLRGFLRRRIDDLRESHRVRLKEIVAGANALVDDFEREQAEEALRQASRPLVVWLQNNAALAGPPASHVQDSLLDATDTAHPATIRASVAREGNWPRLSYGHHLSHGARTMATQMLEPKLHGFREIASNVMQRDELAAGHHLVLQAVRAMEEGFDGLIRKVQLVGQSVYSDDLEGDADFWQGCVREWKRGAGYRDRVNRRNAGWFQTDLGKDADTRVVDLISEEWSRTVGAVTELMPAN